MNWLKIIARGWQRQCLRPSSKTGGMLSGPPLELAFSLLIDRKTSCSVIVMVSKILSGIRLSCVIVFIEQHSVYLLVPWQTYVHGLVLILIVFLLFSSFYVYYVYDRYDK